MALTCINQLWIGDITYIPLEMGFAYLVANYGLFHSTNPSKR